MDRADFVHLVRLSEQASATDGEGYRRSVMAFTLLGYAWVLGCLVVGAGLFWWAAGTVLHGRLRSFHIIVALAAAGLVWTSLRALWFRLEEPEGLRLKRKEAPALFEALERIRQKVKGPPLHAVFLTGDLNASIGQRPRWGLFGGARNHLTLGVPMLMALDRQRLLAVLAHEYGHLRGDHGRFAAWIYRTRTSWARFHAGLQGGNGFVALLSQGFLDWYFPRFVARTFAMARQDEYEADRISGKLLGADVAGAALVEVGLKDDWLGQAFWRQHWARAADHPVPQGPFRAMQKALAEPLPEAFARTALRQALRRIGGMDDTHPGLRDRLEALQVPAEVPSWSRGSALQLLGAKADAAIAHFDKQWCAAHAHAWKQHHAYLGRVRGRVRSLMAVAARSASEWTELGDLQRRLDPATPVQDCYEQALGQSPTHADALRGLYRSLPETEAPQRLALLERLHASGKENTWWAAQEAVAQLEGDPQHDARALQAWRGRLKQAEAAEERAAAELSEPPFLEATTQPRLNDFERAEFEAGLGRFAPVARAWLLRKTLKEFPARRAYLLFVEVPGLDDNARWELCRALGQAQSLPGSVMVQWAGAAVSVGELRRKAGAPMYERSR